MRSRALALAFVFCLASVALAEAPPEPTSRPATTRASDEGHGHGPSEDKLSVTQGEVTVGGQALKYEATAGTLLLKDDAGKPRANFFFVAYREDAPADAVPSARPITFVFNGGPGAAAVWLHLGALGPKKVDVTDEGFAPPPPHRLVDNPDTWLDRTDLVFIDPVGTGYSRPVEGVKGEEFYGVEHDLASISEFIRLYLTRYGRWTSPKFLAGESYGTTRAAALSQYLLDNDGIDLNGIVLISTVLNFQTLEPSDGNDLPYALYVPTYAALAAYHKKTDAPPDLDAYLADAEHWATTDYLTALAKGGALPAQDRAAVVAQLSKYIGLPPAFIDKSNLRVSPFAFEKQLLNDEHRVLGRFDGRVTGIDTDPATRHPDFDPSLSQYLPIYTSTFQDYCRRVLKFESDLKYEVLSGRVGPWDFGRGGDGYLDVSGDLRSAMVKNPHLRVLICSGKYDLATPFAATDYTVHHLDDSGQVQSRITQTYYPGGHMLYHPKAGLDQLKKDFGAFVDDALKR